MRPGFSRLTREEKVGFLVGDYLKKEDKNELTDLLKSFKLLENSAQEHIESFSENTISNFHMPYGIAPYFLINNVEYVVPMVIEESSVVAAASSAAKFWKDRGGFTAKVISTKKMGHVHFYWNITPSVAISFFESIKHQMMNLVSPLTDRMKKRGGGLIDLQLIDKNKLDKNYFQIEGTFETCDAMGANFINSTLEQIGASFQKLVASSENLTLEQKEIDIVMAILSNYTPESLVYAYGECSINDLKFKNIEISSKSFAKKFQKAIHISKIDISRATTHNKGIFNGIDSVALATGNDFRAIEAGGHAFASREGHYQGLSDVSIIDDKFRFSITIPLSVGTVGGLTVNHPLAKVSLEILRNPTAKNLMEIMACVGLAQNFSAVKSLVTTGIQKGHMRLHLKNILNTLQASEEEIRKSYDYFSSKIVSYSCVREYLNRIRTHH